MRVGIFGGTFNPIHAGHLLAAHAFCRQAALDRLLVIPDRVPPHKSMEENQPQARLSMARLAFEADGRFSGIAEVSDREMRRETPSYSILTVEELRAEGMTDLWLYCGTDMLLSLDSWYRAPELMRLVTVAFAGREKGDARLAEQITAKKEFLKQTYGATIFDLSFEPIAVSSSEIRRKIAGGEDVSALLPPAVYAYIKENRLYQ